MANRRSHKKLYAEVRARMAATGESYQKARARVLSSAVSVTGPRTDLVAFSYYGVPATLATIEMHGMAVALLLPSSTHATQSHRRPLPIPIARVVMSRGGVQ